MNALSSSDASNDKLKATAPFSRFEWMLAGPLFAFQAQRDLSSQLSQGSRLLASC